MAGTMTNEEIMSEFEELFGSNTDEEVTSTEEPTEDDTEETAEESQTTSDETASEQEETSEETTDETASEQEEPAQKDIKQSKQNYAFAEQRLQIKENDKFIRNLGKLIGFDDKASLNDIRDKVKEVLIEKTAKENNISVELAQRLDRAEELLQENDRIKLENKVQEDFANIIDKYNLDEDAVQEFTTYLIENGKNPIVDRNVDIDAEYLKLHYNDMIKIAVDEALAKEDARKKKVEEKAASGVPKGVSDKSESKINTVKELDDLFANMDL